MPNATIVHPTDAVIRVTRACICGSDLWPYHELAPTETGRRMGHEAIGVVEAVGTDVRTVKRGDVVVMPFAYSDGTCMFCDEALQTSCIHGGFFGTGGEAGGAQAEALRIPQADGTLFVLPVGADDALMPSLLTLSDVMGTGHHAARTARVGRGKKAAVVGDGAVGLCGVIAAKRLGAEQIIILGRHSDRIVLVKAFGATDVVSERGDEAVERVRALTGGFGVHSVLECVAPSKRCAPRSTSPVRAAPWAVSVFLITEPSPPRRRCSTTTSASAAAPLRSAPISRSCSRTSLRGRSNPAAFSTGSSASTRSPTVTELWTSARQSKSW